MPTPSTTPAPRVSGQLRQLLRDASTTARTLRAAFDAGFDHASEGLRALEGHLHAQGVPPDIVEAAMDRTLPPPIPTGPPRLTHLPQDSSSSCGLAVVAMVTNVPIPLLRIALRVLRTTTLPVTSPTRARYLTTKPDATTVTELRRLLRDHGYTLHPRTPGLPPADQPAAVLRIDQPPPHWHWALWHHRWIYDSSLFRPMRYSMYANALMLPAHARGISHYRLTPCEAQGTPSGLPATTTWPVVPLPAEDLR